MTVNDILDLVHSGFTKEEIVAMTSVKEEPEKVAPEDTPTSVVIDEVQKEVPKEEPELESKGDKEVKEKEESTPQTIVNNVPIMTDAQVEKLAQMLNLGSASIDLPSKPNIDESLAEHFKSLMLGN